METSTGGGGMRMSDPTRIDIDFDPTTKRMVGIATHGNTYFDVPFISQVTDTLWQGGCENGLVLPTHITDVVSLYRWEAYETDHDLRSNVTITMYDSEHEPDREEVEGIAHWILDRQRLGGTVLVHCQAGLNRSGLIAAVTLVLDPSNGIENGQQAVAALRESRSDAVLCNPAFRAWVERTYR